MTQLTIQWNFPLFLQSSRMEVFIFVMIIFLIKDSRSQYMPQNYNKSIRPSGIFGELHFFGKKWIGLVLMFVVCSCCSSNCSCSDWRLIVLDWNFSITFLMMVSLEHFLKINIGSTEKEIYPALRNSDILARSFWQFCDLSHYSRQAKQGFVKFFKIVKEKWDSNELHIWVLAKVLIAVFEPTLNLLLYFEQKLTLSF